jgi:hypothetical protein
MAKIIDTQPDRIEQRPSGQHLFYFTGGKDFVTLPVGAKYVVVYEPTEYNITGRAVMYEVAKRPDITPWAKHLKERWLTDEEIAHFEGLIADRVG